MDKRPVSQAAFQAGFTLVEVLVALSITAVALAAGTQASESLMNMAQRQRMQWIAQTCADNALADLRLSRAYPSAGSAQTPCTQGSIELSVVTEVIATLNPSFRRVQISVSDPQASQDHGPLLTLSTLVGRH